MTTIRISTSKNIVINTENNRPHRVEISTYLGTLVFKKMISPNDKTIIIKGLNQGKYIIQVFDASKLEKKTIEL